MVRIKAKEYTAGMKCEICDKRDVKGGVCTITVFDGSNTVDELFVCEEDYKTYAYAVLLRQRNKYKLVRRSEVNQDR